ncbi:MAG: ABC transporter ATP-binding protein [Candidatus Bathyarchaeia archaeon]|nr:ABC transporter ATP-binding protein [Candidatus Bathyarchaeota archaeon]
MVALNNVSLEINDKEYLCIIGPSGCGKTTLIKCIAGIVDPDEGEIYVDNKLVNNLPIEDRNTGYVFQEIALFPHMNVYDNLCYGPFVKGYKISSVRSLIEEMLHMMELYERVKNYPDELSGGARQKVAVARALVSGSQLLLLDEPLGALDTKVRSLLRYELRRLVKDLGLTAIHVTHDQEEAMSIADRIAVMRSGRIIEVGTPLDLYLNPKNLFTAYFVGEANFLEGEVIGEGDDYTKIDVNGYVLYSARKVNFDSKRVVVAIRPEFIEMSKKTIHREALKGVIENKSFLGSSFRFEVSVENSFVVSVKTQFSTKALKFDVGERVSIFLPPKFLLLYPYPEEGLEKAISIE